MTLFIDADERVTPPLAKEIQSAVQSSSPLSGYYLHRQDYLWDKPLNHGDTSHATLLRLSRTTSGSWSGCVHEIWNIPGPTGRLSHSLDHFPHPTLSAFLAEINFYSTLRAQELHSLHQSSSLVSIIIYPLAKFIQNFFLRLGFLDGHRGFIHALIMSFHSFLVRSKLHLLNNHHLSKVPSPKIKNG